jgi:hypothetical protein
MLTWARDEFIANGSIELTDECTVVGDDIYSSIDRLLIIFILFENRF